MGSRRWSCIPYLYCRHAMSTAALTDHKSSTLSIPDKALCTFTPPYHSLSPDLLGNSHFPNSVQVLGLQISAYNLFLNLPVQRYFPNCSQKATLVLNRACKSGPRGDKQTESESACRWLVLALQRVLARPAFLSGIYN